MVFDIQHMVLKNYQHISCTLLFFIISYSKIYFQTGSGKTAAFVIPTAVSMKEEDGCEYTRDTWEGPATPLSLILAPTRELCSQIYDECRKLFHKSKFKVSQCYGGVEVKPQMKDLSRGCDILIATPGRLIDFIDRGVLSMEWVTFLTLDEADRMLDMGFMPQVTKIVEERDMPPKSERQALMFSATFPKEIQQLATSFLNRDYIWISVGRVGAAADTVEQEFIPIYPTDWNHDGDKLQPLYDELHKLDLKGKDKVLIFVGMKRTASWLAHTIYTKGRVGCSEIHGDLTQPERERALAAFKSGDKPVLVATEVAARGLDIPKISLVINFDMPTQIDDYVHRIGRTGRVGNQGRAVSLFRTYKCQKCDSDLAPELCQLLDTCKEQHGHAHTNITEIPDWLEEEARRSKNRHKWDKLGGRKGDRGAGHRDHRGGGTTHKLKGGKGKGKGKSGSPGDRYNRGSGDRGYGDRGGYGDRSGGDRGDRGSFGGGWRDGGDRNTGGGGGWRDRSPENNRGGWRDNDAWGSRDNKKGGSKDKW